MPLGVAPAEAAAACQGNSLWLVLAEVPVSRGNLWSQAGAGSWGLVQGPGDPAWPGPWWAAVSCLGGMLVEDVGEALPQQRAGARAGHLGPLGIISGGRGHGHCLPGHCMAVPTLSVPLRSSTSGAEGSTMKAALFPDSWGLDVHFPGGSVVKNPPANAGDAGNVGLIPGWGRSSAGNGNPLQCSCLGNPLDRGACSPRGHKELGTTE